jgi:hypothetical protein
MANLVGIVAPSGSGKSTSIFKNEKLNIKGLDPSETIIINVSGKPLPVKGGNTLFPIKRISEGGRQVITSDAKQIAEIIRQVNDKVPEIKNLVIDDAQYLQAFAFMSKVREKGYDKFSEIGEIGFIPVREASKCTRTDLNIFFLYHEETDKAGNKKIKTAGNMIDQYITMEGMFTVVLYAKVEYDLIKKESKYYFMTNTDGSNTAKSPVGMFDDLLIPNDLGYVKDKMEEYYN